MKDLISNRNTKYGQKRLNESLKIADILNNKQTEQQVLKEENETRIEVTNNDFATLAHNRKSRQKRVQLMEKTNFYNENSNELIEHFLFSVVNEALLVDKELKDLNKEYMTKQIAGITDYLVKAGEFVKFNESLTMENVLESIEYHIDLMFQNKDNEENVKAVREAYQEDMKSYVEYVAESVKDKVADVVRKEQNIASVITESTDEIKLKDTLFKTIQLENTKMALKEEEKSEVDETVMQRSFAESLFDYTLLETLNTLKIISIDTQALRNGLPRFFK